MAVGNNGSRLVGNTEFYGGLSTDNKIGVENSYADGECLDVRKSPSQMTVLPMSRTLPDGGVITGLMTAMTQSKDGNIWGVDEHGKVYKIDADNAITAVSGGDGEVTVSSSSFEANYDHELMASSPETMSGEYVFTYNNKNLVYTTAKTNEGITFEYNSTTGETTVSGTPTQFYSIAGENTLELPAGTYTMSIQSAVGFYVGIGIRDKATNHRVGYTIPAGDTENTFTLTSPAKAYDVYITNLTAGAEVPSTTFKVQLEHGDEATAFQVHMSNDEWEYDAGSGNYDYYDEDALSSNYGITYSGAPIYGDTITISYTPGAYSSGFSLENSDIDDGLWFADGGHRLFSYGKVLNPSGATRETHSFEFLEDHSEYTDFAIVVQQNQDQVFYQSDEDIPRKGGTSTCTVGTTINETKVEEYGSANIRQYAALYLPAQIPIAEIGIRFMEKGSGTVHIEVHDENDNVLASSAEVSADDVVTDGYTSFTVRPNPDNPLSPSNQFTCTPWAGDTLEAGSVMHIHIVASDSGWSVKTSVDNDMSLTLDFTSTAYVLHETFNKKHPMVMYDKLYIGNGKYVSTKESTPLNYIDDTLYTSDTLRLDDGFEVCSFGSSDEYLMIGAEKYSAGSSRGFQAGRIYFWDRQSEGPNFYIDCNMGSPKAIYNFGNIVYIIIAGALYAYTGGKELVKVRTLKGTDTEYSGQNSITEVYPNMMAIRREILLIGFPSETSAYTVRHGIYGFGSVDKNYLNSFTYNYKIPGPNTNVTLDQHNSDNQHFRIGCVYNFNDTLFYSYEVTSTYNNVTTTRVALAVVDNNSGTSTSFLWKSLQYDAGCPAFEKMALRVGIYFDPLPESTTITPIYRIDDGEWQTGPATASTGDNYITCEINKRFHELQYGLVGTTGNDMLTPVIKQVSAEVRVLNEERKL